MLRKIYIYIPDVETGVKLVQGWVLPQVPTRLPGTSTKLILPQSHTSQIGPLATSVDTIVLAYMH
jgi:hypothetical protein